MAGVARGLSRRFAWPVAAVRLVFVLSVLLGGWGVLVYIALWIAMPLEPVLDLPTPPQEASHPGVQRPSGSAERASAEAHPRPV